MKFRHPLQLEAYLDKALAWRKKELTTLKFAVESASASDAKVLLRAGTAMLYAHWEGFIKDAGTNYLRFVAEQTPDVQELSTNFVAITMAPRITMCAASQRTSLHIELIENVRKPSLNGRMRWRGVVRTRSNLKSEVLREALITLGLEFKPFEPKSKTVIDRLVNARNSIAHGKGTEVDQEEYDQLHEGIVALLDEFKTQLETAVSTKRYLSAYPSQSPVGETS